MRMITLLLVSSFLLFPTSAIANGEEGEQANGKASSEGIMFVGEDPYDSNQITSINGEISLNVVNHGDRGSTVQNIDEVEMEAHITSDFGEYRIVMKEPMLKDPNGKQPTWAGVGYDKKMHGNTHTRTSMFPKVEPDIAAYGWADVYQDGNLIKSHVPTQVKMSKDEKINGVILEIDTDSMSIPDTPSGYLHVQWPDVDKLDLPKAEKRTREWIGMGFLIGLVLWFGFLAIRERNLNVDSVNKP